MMNKIWGVFIILGILFSFITGNAEVINNEIINAPGEIFSIFLSMLPLMILWSGIMNIAKDAGLLDKIANLMTPLFRIIFPDIPKGHESLGYIASNLTINMLGIHNASTPFGLKAMKSLNELNTDKKKASRSMITFLVLNTSGVTIIATDIIAIRSMYGSSNPSMILVTTIMATVLGVFVGLILDKLLYKIWRKK
ncbi:MAG: spore maturation protein [Bacilli bacterium]|nr:spore maturation protein [Bacilli bacterium]